MTRYRVEYLNNSNGKWEVRCYCNTLADVDYRLKALVRQGQICRAVNKETGIAFDIRGVR